MIKVANYQRSCTENHLRMKAVRMDFYPIFWIIIFFFKSGPPAVKVAYRDQNYRARVVIICKYS